MFDGIAYSSVFGGDGTPPDIDLLHERLDLLTGSASFSLQFGPGFPCEFPSSVTLTVQVECPSPSANASVVAPCASSIEPKPDTIFPAGKASLSTAEKAGLSAERTAVQVERGLAEEGQSIRAEMAANGGLPERAAMGRPDIATLRARGLEQQAAVAERYGLEPGGRIRSATGTARFRVPDYLAGESKAVNVLRDTPQVEDFVANAARQRSLGELDEFTFFVRGGENPTVVHQSFYNLVDRYGELYGVEDYIRVIWFE